MKTYIIGNYNIHTIDSYMEYTKKVPHTITKFGGKTLIADHEPSNLEGKPGAFTVVVEFPDRVTTDTWYNSTEYQSIIDLRKNSVDGWVQMVSEFNLPT